MVAVGDAAAVDVVVDGVVYVRAVVGACVVAVVGGAAGAVDGGADVAASVVVDVAVEVVAGDGDEVLVDEVVDGNSVLYSCLYAFPT